MDLGVDYAYATSLPKRSGDAVLTMLRSLISMFGKPESMLSNNGEEFMSYPVQNFLCCLGICHIHTSLYHPQTNSRLEKFNDNCVQMLARCTSPERQDVWDQYLPDVCLAHNSHIKPMLGNSPAYLLYGFEPRLPHDFIFDTIRVPPTDEEIAELQAK
jgi:transposase InsO family protein